MTAPTITAETLGVPLLPPPAPPAGVAGAPLASTIIDGGGPTEAADALNVALGTHAASAVAKELNVCAAAAGAA
jgi:hypothetical protein